MPKKSSGDKEPEKTQVKRLKPAQIAGLSPIEIDTLLGLLALYEDNFDIVRGEFYELTEKSLTVEQMKQVQQKHVETYDKLVEKLRDDLDTNPLARPGNLLLLIWKMYRQADKREARSSFKVGSGGNGDEEEEFGGDDGYMIRYGPDWATQEKALKLAHKVNMDILNYQLSKERLEHEMGKKLPDPRKLKNLIKLEDGLGRLRENMRANSKAAE